MNETNRTADTVSRISRYLGNRRIGLFTGIFLSFVATGSTLYGAYRIKPIINDYIMPGNLNGLLHAVLILSGIYFVGIIASTLQTQIMLRVAYGTIKDIRRDLFQKLQRLPISHFDTRSHGDIMSLFTNDIDALQVTLEQSIMQVLNNTLQMIGSISLMFVLGRELLWITLSMTVIMLLTVQLLGKSSQKHFIAQQNYIGAVNGEVEETTGGHETIQVFHCEELVKAKFHEKNESYRKSSTKAQGLSGLVLPVVNYVNAINLALTATMGAIMTLNGSFSIGALTSYLQLTITYNQPFKQISMQVNNVLQGLAGAKRIFTVLDEAEEINEGKVTLEPLPGHTSAWAWKQPLANGEAELVPLKGDIRFEHVDFAYEPGKAILRNISLYAKPGQKIAFVGSTGAGKTTITNLLNRFYNIQSGRITYDGIDIKDIREDDLRRSLGMVLQDTHLFTGTIMDNIRYGKLDATDKEVIAAAKLTRADYFISRLPEGYQTMLVREGENLSSGQRQLIAIARTAIANPPVLVLDEATSSVDTRTEALVSQGMSALMDGRTVFVIAHRLSTVRNSKAIIVLENGEIIERGEHDFLMAQKGRYYQLNEGLAELS